MLHAQNNIDPDINNTTNDNFLSPSKGERTFLEVIADILEFLAEDVESKYAVVVGTDSEECNGLADFVSVITVHRLGKYGRYFWRKKKDVKVFDRHDRILKEAFFSLELAQKLIEILRQKLNGAFYEFEIHLDIGQNGPTKQMIQELVGMITGNGFTARIKPEAYAATKVADRHC